MNMCSDDWIVISDITAVHGLVGGMYGGPLGAFSGMSVGAIISLGCFIFDDQRSLNPIRSIIEMTG